MAEIVTSTADERAVVRQNSVIRDHLIPIGSLV